jgi:hypothetical protein
MELGPAGTRFAAECAVALVNEVRSLWDFDANSAAETGELQHSHIISGSRLFGSWRLVFLPFTAVSTSAAPGTKCQIFTTTEPSAFVSQPSAFAGQTSVFSQVRNGSARPRGCRPSPRGRRNGRQGRAAGRVTSARCVAQARLSRTRSFKLRTIINSYAPVIMRSPHPHF